MEQLKVNYTTEANHLHVTLAGKLILIDALTLKADLPDKIGGVTGVTIDLLAVDDIDLTGFNALLMTKKHIGDKPLHIKVQDGHEFHNLVHLTKFSDQFIISN